ASALPGNIPDIIPHCIEYAILAFFFIRVCRDTHDRKQAAAACAALLLLAFLDELHQSAVPGRFCKAEDLLFDALGIALGLLAYFRLERVSAANRGSRWARWLNENWFNSRPA
ncbi:MAG TPA: VanZ family protein, partial [Candidatus Binatia bacterium]|nr:VanZ family protein [Candidatus Binatia bacterium]